MSGPTHLYVGGRDGDTEEHQRVPTPPTTKRQEEEEEEEEEFAAEQKERQGDPAGPDTDPEGRRRLIRRALIQQASASAPASVLGYGARERTRSRSRLGSPSTTSA
jgi:hypothetical protein